MKAKIVGIKKPFEIQTKKDGGTFGPAMLAIVELENDEETTVWLFEEKAIGETLDLEQKGQYWNVKRQPKQGNDLSKSNDLDKAINMLFEQNKELVERLDAVDSTLNEMAVKLEEVASTLLTPPIPDEPPEDFLK